MKKYSVVLIYFFLSAIVAHGQSPDWSWARKGNGDSYFKDVSALSTEGCISAGSFTNTVIFNSSVLTSIGNADGCLVSYDSAGIVSWVKSISGVEDEVISCVTTDQSGYIYIAGSFNSPSCTIGNITLFNPGYNFTWKYGEIFIAKLDPSGNLIWAKAIAGSGDEYASGMTMSGDSVIYLTGSFTSDSLFLGNDTIYRLSQGDIYLLKMDTAGTIQWGSATGGNNTDYSSDICIDNSGNVYVSATSYSNFSFGSSVITNAGERDAILLKWNSSGTPLWAKEFSSATGDFNHGICADVSGNIYTCGNYTTSAFDANGIALPPLGGSQLFVIKTDSSGNTIWAKSFGGLFEEVAIDICYQNNGIIIGGQFLSPEFILGNDTLYNTSNGFETDVYLFKMDLTGNVLWSTEIQGNSREFTYAIDANNSSALFISGTFYSTVMNFGTSGTVLNNTNNVFQAYIGKLDITSTGLYNLSTDEVFIYPNPASQYFTLQFIGAKCDIQIFNIEGKLVKGCSLTHANEKIDINHLNPGIYFVKLHDKEGYKSGRILVR